MFSHVECVKTNMDLPNRNKISIKSSEKDKQSLKLTQLSSDIDLNEFRKGLSKETGSFFANLTKSSDW